MRCMHGPWYLIMITFNPTEHRSTLTPSSPLKSTKSWCGRHQVFKRQYPAPVRRQISSLLRRQLAQWQKAITHSLTQPSLDVHHSIAHQNLTSKHHREPISAPPIPVPWPSIILMPPYTCYFYNSPLLLYHYSRYGYDNIFWPTLI